MGKNKIVVHVPNYMYFGGDVVHGVVELNLDSSIKSRGVRMVFHGYEDVLFQRQVGKTTVTYHEKWIFLQYRMDLAGSPREGRAKAPVDIIQPGVYRWPFSLKLPDFIAPSVKLTYGVRRYRCGAYVDIPRAFDLTYKIDLAVGGNTYNPYQYLSPGLPPAQRVNHKSFVFASGKLHMTSLIVKENFFVGDTCHVKVMVDNQSTKNVDFIQLSLVDHRTYYACGACQFMTKKLHKQKFDIAVPSKSSNTSYYEFVIPEVKYTSTTPSPVSGVKLIKVEFFVVVKLSLNWAIDLRTSHFINVMKRDPKFVYGLPMPGPSIPMTGRKAFYVPPHPPTFAPPQLDRHLWPNPISLQNFYGNSDGVPPVGPQPLPAYSIMVSSPSFADPASVDPSSPDPARGVDPASVPSDVPHPEPAVDYSKPEYQPHIAINYPAVDGYEFPQNTAIVAVEAGQFNADAEEESLMK